MLKTLNRGLSSRNGFVRKGSVFLLQVPKWLERQRTDRDRYFTAPPVLANSFPKSGTHLLYQVVGGLPQRVNFGAFLGSMTSSFKFRERTVSSVQNFIHGLVPGEIVRGHLFFDERYVEDLANRNVVHYFIYRDPRDVIVSEAHYARDMNRWHRLHPYFRRLSSLEEAIRLSIKGFDPPIPGIDYPNILERFLRYKPWLSHESCLPIRFEDMMSERRPAVIRDMARFYAARCREELDVEQCATMMEASIAPKKSHTFRSGKRGGWREKFTPEHRELFAAITGDLIIELGYEPDDSWIREPVTAVGECHHADS